MDTVPNSNSAKVEKPRSGDKTILSSCKKTVQSFGQPLYSCSRPHALGIFRTFCELQRDCLLPTCCKCFLCSPNRSRNLPGYGCPSLKPRLSVSQWGHTYHFSPLRWACYLFLRKDNLADWDQMKAPHFHFLPLILRLLLSKPLCHWFKWPSVMDKCGFQISLYDSSRSSGDIALHP